MNNNELISIITPIYNTGAYLLKCMESLIYQTYAHLEILLVDDGSVDTSGQVCDENALTDSRIIVIHKSNTGVSNSRNIGIELSNGEYFHFLDSDDYVELDTYEYCLGLMREYDCDAVAFEHYVTVRGNVRQHSLPDAYYGLYKGKDEIIKIFLRTAFAWNKLFARNLIIDAEEISKVKFREDIFRGEDGIFSMEALNNADRVYFTNRPLYHYVQSEESACRGVFRPSQLSLLKAMEYTESFFRENYPEYLPQLEVRRLESYIMLYSDMYLDDCNYQAECNEIAQTFRKQYRNNKYELSAKQRVKFVLFNISPRLFSRIHAVNLHTQEVK